MRLWSLQALVQREELFQNASFEAELRPFLEIEMHARVNGYLDAINVDAGDLVKENQVIATLDVPELKTEMEHAVADERRLKAEIDRAQAMCDDAHLNYTRVMEVIQKQPKLIAQQDIDAAKAKDRAAKASLSAAQEQDNVALAEIKKLHVLQDYTKITAPFNGVITKRYADPGALIQAGTSTGAQPLVRLSENDLLRAVFPVSVSFVAGIKVGAPVELRVESLHKTIVGKVARFSRKVDTSTRNMDVEVDVPNADLAITPGMYATVSIKTEMHSDALSVPVDAISRTGESATLYVINKDRKIEERTVKVGLETPARLEILNGVSEGEMVLLGSRAAVRPGEVVEPRVSAEKASTTKVAQSTKVN